MEMNKGKLWPYGTEDFSWKNNIVHVEVPIAKYVDKLVKAWERYKTLIICVDFDDTLVGHEEWNKDICNEVCETVAKAQTLGAKVILWTCRQADNIIEDVMWLSEIYGIRFDDINPSEPFKERFSNKPYCNIMLDDKCGLEQALQILKFAIEIYESRTTTESDESPGND